MIKQTIVLLLRMIRLYTVLFITIDKCMVRTKVLGQITLWWLRLMITSELFINHRLIAVKHYARRHKQQTIHGI